MNRIERLSVNEEWVQVAADCIQRRHPHALWLAGKRPQDMNDATITEALRRLKAWLAEHETEWD